MRMKLIASETVQMAFSMRFRLRHDWDSSDPERLPGKPTRTQRKTAAGSKWIGHTGSTIDSIKDSKGDSSQIFISPYSSLHIHLSIFISPCSSVHVCGWSHGRLEGPTRSKWIAKPKQSASERATGSNGISPALRGGCGRRLNRLRGCALPAFGRWFCPHHRCRFTRLSVHHSGYPEALHSSRLI